MTRNKVAFIAHPLNLSTLSVISGWPIKALRMVGNARVRQFLEKKKPFIFSRMEALKSKIGAEIDLIAVACPLLPEQMAGLDSKFVISRIIQSVKLAEQDGANIAVLGGFTSVIGNEGEDVANSVGIPVTSGNTFTAGLAIEAVEVACRKIGIKRLDRVAIVGATGDIGQACAKYFASKAKTLAFVARDQERLLKFAEQLKSDFSAQITCHKRVSDAIRDADVVITATSALTTIIDPLLLKPGAIVCDVALPANIAREVSRIRRDVVVFEGGLSKVPFIDNPNLGKKWSHLMPHNAIYGCLAEGLVLGFEGMLERFSLGRGNITQDRVKLIMNVAQKHGFQISDFFCGDKFYTQENLQTVADAVAEPKPTFHLYEGAEYK